MRFKLSNEAKKYIDSLDKETIKRIYTALRDLTKDPPKGDIKPLKGQQGYRLRVGELRILFTHKDNTVNIDKIAPRGEAYK